MTARSSLSHLLILTSASAIALCACAPSQARIAESRTVFLRASDGTPLIATLHLPGDLPAPAALLLHVAGGSRREWEPWAKRLSAAGYVSLALDFRGYGQSGGALDYPRMTDDAAAAFEYLVRQPFVRADRIALAGGSLGANVALAYAAQEPRVQGVALLSPGLGNYGYVGVQDAARYGARPLLLLAGEGEPYAAEIQQQFAAIAPAATARLLPTARHGTALLVEPAAWHALLPWLEETLK